jgi:hypothetical protein
MIVRTKKMLLRKHLFLLTVVSAFVFSTVIGYSADERLAPAVLNASVFNILQEEHRPVTRRVQELARYIIEEKKTFFLSYCWDESYSTEPMVNDFELFLNKLGIRNYLRDKRQEQGFGMVPNVDMLEFMQKAKTSDVVVIFLNDAYLRSRNCMYEFFQVWDAENQKISPRAFIIKHPDFNSIFPKRDPITGIKEPQQTVAIPYIQYWEEESKRMRRVEPVNKAHKTFLRSEEDFFDAISESMPAITLQVTNHILEKYGVLRQRGFENVLRMALPGERNLIMEELGDDQKQNARIRELEHEVEDAQKAEGEMRLRIRRELEAQLGEDVKRIVEEREWQRNLERQEAELREEKARLAIRETLISNEIAVLRIKHEHEHLRDFSCYGARYEGKHIAAAEELIISLKKSYKSAEAGLRILGEKINYYKDQIDTITAQTKYYESMCGKYEECMNYNVAPDWEALRCEEAELNEWTIRIQRNVAAELSQMADVYEGIYGHAHPRREEFLEMAPSNLGD